MQTRLRSLRKLDCARHSAHSIAAPGRARAGAKLVRKARRRWPLIAAGMSKIVWANSCAAVDRMTSGWWDSKLSLMLISTVPGKSGSVSQAPKASRPSSS
jgi:hypothetical protein